MSDSKNPYNSTDSIIKRCEELGQPDTAAMLERVRYRVVEDGEGGYYLENPPEDATDAEWFATLATLFGAALEREYPAEAEEATR